MSIQPQIPLSPLRDFLKIRHLPNPVLGGAPWRINDRAYFILSMILYFLEVINPKNTFNHKLARLYEKYPIVDRKSMGYPDGWSSEPLWRRNNYEG